MNRRAVLFALGLMLVGGTARTAEFEPGRRYFGERKFVEYVAGDLPLVLSAPHGGHLDAVEIPKRERGVVQSDAFTQELARAIAAEVEAQAGRRVHLIVCHLHRRRLDCNREVLEAAAGDPLAEKAWTEYHGFIESALAAAVSQRGRAFLIDLHGHAHKDVRVELGYLHSQEVLARSDAALDAPGLAAVGSLRHLIAVSKAPYSALLRGPRSLGALLEARGFPSTPSPGRPTPNLPYFQGGYTIRRHVATEAPVAGVQIECNRPGLRDTATNRARFARALVSSLREYLAEHFALPLTAE